MKIEFSLKNTEPDPRFVGSRCCNLHRMGQGDARQQVERCVLFFSCHSWCGFFRAATKNRSDFSAHLLLLHYNATPAKDNTDDSCAIYHSYRVWYEMTALNVCDVWPSPDRLS